MDRNHNWYPQNNGYYNPNDGYQRQTEPQSTNTPESGVAAGSVDNAQRLLAIYPMASATPTHHVARHLNNMHFNAAPPSFARPTYYAPPNSFHANGNPPPYSEYDQQISYLGSSQLPVRNSEYWESTRNDAVRLLGDAGPSSYPYQTPYHWGPSLAAPSSFQTPHFAQSIFHHAAPSSAYPTPPPPTMTSSSSSLAFALGPPAPRERPRTPPQPKVYPPKDSGRFFNDFIARKTQEMNAPAQPVNHTITQIQTPRRNQVPQVEESPDPLALKPASSRMSVSPLKRKVEVVVEVESPSVKKRIHYLETTKNEPHKSNDLPITPKQPTKPGTKPLPTSILKKSFPSTPTPKRGVNLAYVEVKQRPWLTPTSSFKGSSNSVVVNKGGRKLDDTPNDLGGYGSEEDDFRSPLHGRHIGDSVKSSARRTGDRDERAPLEKLIALIEDIFEAEDSLPPDADAKDLPAEYFSPLTSDSSHPMLHPNIIKKLTKYIGQVSRPTKRLRQGATGSMGTPRVKGRMAEVDTQVLSRVLKLLDRNVKAGEDVDPFHYVATSFSAKASPRKSASKKTARPKNDQRTSQSPNLDQVDFAPSRELNESDFDKLARLLDLARDSIIAADCCIALLGSDRLAKQLYSEELITGCLNSIKNQLTQIIYPFVEASADPGFNANNNPLLFHVVRNNDSVSQSRRNQLSETFQALSAVLPRINALINAESVSMSDSIIIQAVYISIGPFFVVEGGSADVKGKKDSVVLKTLGKSAMRGLRLDALALIRSIFANHEDQRSWIIEEILTSLIKLSDTKQKAGQFRLRDGRSIRTVSALLLQLVQTSAHDVRIDARKIEKSRQNKIALRRQESFSESQQQINETFLDENDREEIRLYTSGLESATKAAKTIILFLTQRSGKGKATKNSNEAEYRAIFDNLIEDLLVVLYWPEWPSAGILLSIVSKYMVSSLDDVKFNTQTDSNAAKTISLDHLGVIAARIRSSTLKVQNGSVESGPDFIGLKPLDEVVSKLSNKELEKLLQAHRDVASHLCKRSSEDQAYDSARELTAAALGQELALALKQVNTWIEEPDADEDMDLLKGGDRTLYFGRKIKTALREVWKDPSTDVFDIGSPEEVIRIDRLAEEIGTIQSLRNSFQPILSIILLALDSPAIFMRTKALRALGQIVTSDSTILSAPNVRRGIESHLLDSSPAVRDAAVELIGKYMIDSPEVAGDYYQKIADRIADTGLSVRKRVIKLLKSFYNVTDDNARKIDITTRLVLRMLDEDDTVKDLAMKTLEEIWFSSSNPSVTRSKNIPISSSQENKSALLTKVVVIMGTSANFKDRQSPLEDMLHKIMADKQGNEAVSLHSRYAEICETLIDGLVDASDLPGFTVINCIRTIYLLTSAYPSILSSSNASTLLPYLKNASSAEELATSDYLLKIFRVSIPHMPKTAAKFGQELQSALQPMIIKPSSGGGGVQVLQETVGCMCIVVQHLTHDFIRLVNLMKSCNARLQQAIKRPATQAMTPNDVRPLLILIFIVSLLGENCNFDRLRQENPNLASEISSISQGPIIDHIYNSLLNLYDKYDSQSIRARILQCLGFLFRAQPTLMTMERSATIMDAIFASPEVEGCGRLLKIMQDFLVSEASKHSAKEKEGTKGKPTEVDMEELVGNTDGFADSGVSSAIVQRYLNPILDAALSQHMQIQATAIDVLSFTIKQGLAHPLQSFPVIVALETSPVTSLSNRASALHAILHGKHASLLNTRYTISARTSFDYQKKIASGTFRGFRETPAPVALLQRWYSLVREKRPTRQDFLKSLVKVFQENPTYRSSQDDVDFTRYMAENFSAFDYKTQEEVITVIKYLTSVLSTIGMHLLEIVSPSHLLTQLHAPSQPFTQQTQEALVPSPAPISASQPITTEVHQVIPVEADNKHLPSDDQDRIMLMRTTVIIAMVMLLKAHLKSLYSLSEDKCNKFVIGKKSAIGDKPAVRRHEKPMSWDRLPFATTPLLTTDDADVQKSRFLEIWNEDGLTAEPEDDYI